MFAMRIFVPILGSSHRGKKEIERITVMRRKEVPEGDVRTVLGDCIERPEGPGDDGGSEEVSRSTLLPKVIEYMTTIETMET
jgi:hypothetical protein